MDPKRYEIFESKIQVLRISEVFQRFLYQTELAMKFIHSFKSLCEIILVKIKLFQINENSQQTMKYL